MTIIMNSRKNEVGFIAVELLSILFVTVVVGLVSWYAWQTHNHATNLALHNPAPTIPVKATTPAPSPPIDTQNPASKTPTSPAPTSAVPARPVLTPPPSAPIPVVNSGIKGQTVHGSLSGCYSQDPNSSCGGPVPVRATIDVQSQGTQGSSGQSIARVTSDANGNFSINLAAGKYFLVPQPLSNGQAADAQSVAVTAGQYVQVTFIYN